MNSKTDSATARKPFHGNFAAGGGQYRRILNTGSAALVAALGEVPGFKQADDALHDFGARGTEFATAEGEQSPGETAATLADRFAAGANPGLSEFAAVAERQLHRDALLQLEKGLIRDVGMRLWADRDQAIAAGAKTIANSLTGRLQKLVESLRAIDVDEGDTDAATAIRRGRTDRYDALQTAAIEFADLRRGVADYLNSFGRGGERDYFIAATVRNVLDVDPFWGVRAEGLVASNSTTGGLVHAGNGGIPTFDGDNLAAELAWLAEHTTAKVWVPTATQYDRALTELKAARGAARSASERSYRIRWHRSEERLGSKTRELEERPASRFEVVRDDDTDADDGDVWEVTRPVSAYT